jgi:hypothetical protein
VKRRYLAIVIFLVAAAAIYFLWPHAAMWFLRPTIPKPRSDIPITADIGWWAYQDGLVINSLAAEAVDPKLNLFNDRFLIRYRVSGTVTYRNGWRPKLVKAQITSRLVSRRADQQPSIADVVLVPVVEVTQDSAYSQQPVPFAVTIEQIVQTMDWGVNRYDVHCLNQTANVSVQQSK